VTLGLPMGAAPFVAALATAGAILVLTTPDSGARRLARMVARPAPPEPGSTGDPGPAETYGRAVAVAAAATGVTLLVNGAVGLLVAAVVGLIVSRLLGKLEPRAVVAEREQMARDLPLAAHLLASAIAVGASPIGAIDVVASALDGPAAPQLRRVAALARLGGDLASTWRSTPPASGLAPLGRTVARALETGAPLAEALERLAVDLRSQQRFEIDRRARSVGVRAAAPLGLCFLPAFLLIGVVPVVLGIATTIFESVG
jgi:Flp pilus assembly protein TadB